MIRDALVIGAGLSGLCTATYLTDAGARVRVVDAAPRLGGLMHTERMPEGLVETAARSFIWTDRVAALFAAAGIEPQFAQDSSGRRFIYRGSRPRRWPLGPIETLGMGGRAGAAWITRRMKPRAGESVASWGQRVIGPSAARWLLAPALQGIYASPTEELSAQAIFGGARPRGKVAAPPGGMIELLERLRARLVDRGATIDLNVRLDDLSASSPSSPSSPSSSPPMVTAICTSAPAAACLLAPHAPTLAAAIARVRVTSLLSVTAFYPRHRNDIRGFGILFPRDAGITALGVLFNSDMFAGRSDRRSETWIYGDQSPAAIERIQAEAHAILRADRGALTGRDDEPEAVYPTPHIAHLPIYDSAVLEVAARLGDLPPWLGLCGNYLGKLGVSAIVETAAATAERLRRRSNVEVRTSNS